MTIWKKNSNSLHCEPHEQNLPCMLIASHKLLCSKLENVKKKIKIQNKCIKVTSFLAFTPMHS